MSKILEKWNQPMHNWALIISQIHIYFDGQLNFGLEVTSEVTQFDAQFHLLLFISGGIE